MGEELRRTLFHAALGSTVGTVVSIASQEVSHAVNTQLSSALGPRGPVFQGVVAGSVAALTLLAGEKVISMVTPLDDPLFRIFYYQTAWHGSTASWGFMRALRAIFSQGMAPRYAPGPVINKAQNSSDANVDKAGCVATPFGTSCGNLRM